MSYYYMTIIMAKFKKLATPDIKKEAERLELSHFIDRNLKWDTVFQVCSLIQYLYIGNDQHSRVNIYHHT